MEGERVKLEILHARGREVLRAVIEGLHEYACHKFTCARIKDAAAKCDCGLSELLSKE